MSLGIWGHLKVCLYDRQRSLYLESLGYRVLRFWNNEVARQIDRVLDVIWRELNK